MESTDAQLVERLAAGDLSALGPIHRRYGTPIVSFLMRVEPTITAQDAEDLSQEVFLTFVDTVGRYEEQGQLKSWLFGIAVGKARNWRRKRVLRWLTGKRHGADAAGVSLHQPATDERVAARQRLHRALAQLPGSQREVVTLHLIEGLSAKETAEVLGISENAVSIRVHRARKALEGV